MKKIYSLFVAFIIIFTVAGCGSSSVTGTSETPENDGEAAASGKTWQSDGSTITIDDIVNGSGSPSLSNKAATSVSAAFYYGRFLYYDGWYFYAGEIKFKLNKYSDSEAYFSDMTLEYLSVVTAFNSSSVVVSSAVDLEVDPQFNSDTNHVEISDTTDHFVSFDVDFGNNDYFGDVENAGVIFSNDFTTMAGGNNASFFFIAQKIDSQPVVAESAVNGTWTVIPFRVGSSSGAITTGSLQTVTVSGTGGNGYTAFIGYDLNDSMIYDGELTLTDAHGGCFAFGFGSGDGSVTAIELDGGFLVSADQSIAVGINALNGNYFAAER